MRHCPEPGKRSQRNDLLSDTGNIIGVADQWLARRFDLRRSWREALTRLKAARCDYACIVERCEKARRCGSDVCAVDPYRKKLRSLEKRMGRLVLRLVEDFGSL